MSYRNRRITAEVSVYALREPRLTPALEKFFGALDREGLTITAGRMSTLIEGEAGDVFEALGAAFGQTAEGHEIVMRATISNACPAESGEEERGCEAANHCEKRDDAL